MDGIELPTIKLRLTLEYVDLIVIVFNYRSDNTRYPYAMHKSVSVIYLSNKKNKRLG